METFYLRGCAAHQRVIPDRHSRRFAVCSKQVLRSSFEHNLDVIKTADWIIDLGPEGGIGGGEVVAVGTPEDIMKVAASHTGQFLQHHLSQH